MTDDDRDIDKMAERVDLRIGFVRLASSLARHGSFNSSHGETLQYSIAVGGHHHLRLHSGCRTGFFSPELHINPNPKMPLTATHQKET